MRMLGNITRIPGGAFSGFSHELKTPLANIRLYAELLAGPRLRIAGRRAVC
jgi:signal transduction histidine kinase